MKNMKMYLLLVLILCFSSAISIAQTGDWGSPETGIVMQYHQPAGTLNNYKVIANTSSDMDAMGQSFNMTMIQTGEVLHKISKIVAEKMTHELSFTKLELDADATVPNFDPSILNANAVLNKPLILETGRRGENYVFKNLNDQPAFSDQGGDLPPSLALIVLVPELASKPVKVNDKWNATNTITLTVLGNEINATVNTEYTFAGMERKMGYDCMKIVGKGKSKTKGSVSANGMDMEMDQEDEIKTTAYFAYKKGIFLEITTETDGDATMDLAGMNMSMGMSITASGKLTYIDK